MGSTLVEKIIARASGRASVSPGEIVTCKVDLAMFHDSSGPRRFGPRLRELGAKVWDPSKVVVATDHYTPAFDVESASIQKLTREWARENKPAAFYDQQGICHIVLAEGGHLKPGMFCVGGDSHSPTGGAFGCYMAGFGATEMTGVIVTGEIWIRVPETIRVSWTGRLPNGVTAKDMMLFLCRTLGMHNAFKAVEYGGEAVRALPMQERLVLTNMAAELGADTGMIEPDAVTLAAIRKGGGEVEEAAALQWRSDADAAYEARHEFDAGALTPQVALPNSPANSHPVETAAGRAIDQAYIGACVGAKLEDLRMAARVLRGRRVAPGVRLMVAPSSLATTREAAADGTLATLTEAGAMLLPTGCGACAAYGAGVLADGEVCISTTNRNFKGRMGHMNSEVYLASPYTVAASAIAGRIADPRALLAEAA